MFCLCPYCRVVRGSISSTQPNPTHQITDPTQPNPTHCQVNLWTHDPTQPIPNPYPYIDQQLACRKKISLCTSCHHHHPNTHRNNANTHSISSILQSCLFQTEAVMHQLQVFTKRICQSIHNTKLHIYTTCIFSHICHFRPMTQPNPLKHKFSTHSRPNPTQPAGQPNPWTTLAYRAFCR